MEGLSVLASCLITVGLYVLLARFDDHEAPHFGAVSEWGITLNTIVAIMVNIAVAASISVVVECISQLKWLWFSEQPRSLADIQVFDEASRGLFGSLKLIWGIRHRSIATTGAFLVVVQLAVAPLTQQSLHYESRSVAAEGINGTLPYMEKYIEMGQQPILAGITPSGYDSLGTGMKSAIISGIFMDTDIVLNDTEPSCPSGNCTFSDWSALAVCTGFANVTSYLDDRSDRKKKDRFHLEYCIADDICITSNYENYQVKVNITSAARGEQFDGPLGSDVRDRTGYNYTSMAFKDRPSPIADFYVLYQNLTTDQYMAVEIVLEWCVQRFSTKVVNGIATTVRLDESRNFTESGYERVINEVDGEDFEVDILTHLSLQRHLAKYLSGMLFYQGGDQADTDVAISFSGALGSLSWQTATRVPRGFPRLGALLNNTATSMTNFLRQKTLRRKNGIVYVQKVYVRISWGWLAAPIIFVVFALLFFIATLVYGRVRKMRGVPAWKSSLLAALQTPDADLHQLLGSKASKVPMFSQIQKLKVQLIKGDGRWSLTESVPHRKVSDQTPLQQEDDGMPLSSL